MLDLASSFFFVFQLTTEHDNLVNPVTMVNIMYVRNNTRPFFSRYLCISFTCRACLPKLMCYWFYPRAKIITTCFFLETVFNFCFMFLQKCQTSNWWSIFFSSSRICFLIWECLSVINISILMFSFFNLFTTLTNANFSILFEFPAWVHGHISISSTLLLAWSKIRASWFPFNSTDQNGPLV